MRAFLVGVSLSLAAPAAFAEPVATAPAAPVDVAAVAPAALPAEAPPTPTTPTTNERLYDCDGMDEFLLDEIDEAFRTGIGYGETWDDTVCEEGLLSVYAEGANRRWPDMRRKPGPPKPKPPEPTEAERRAENQFFALAMPIFGAAAFAVAVGLAALIGLFLRLRKQIVVDVGCPGCKTALPFVVGESPQIFCPRCGAACRVDVIGKGKGTTATAIPL